MSLMSYWGCVQGYKAITGKDPPFINMCWWINDFILPELTVYRGETYYFKVQGGDSDSLGKQNYHPFYITSDPNGGYGNKIESERGEPGGFLKILTSETNLHNESMNRTKNPQN